MIQGGYETARAHTLERQAAEMMRDRSPRSCRCRLARAEGGVKICFVIPSLPGGGAERVAVTVLSALDGARHERVLYLFSAQTASTSTALRPASAS